MILSKEHLGQFFDVYADNEAFCGPAMSRAAFIDVVDQILENQRQSFDEDKEYLRGCADPGRANW